MAAGDVAEGEGAGEHGQAEGQGHAEQADAERIAFTAEVGREHRRATAAKDQPQRAEELGGQTFAESHRHPR